MPDEETEIEDEDLTADQRRAIKTLYLLVLDDVERLESQIDGFDIDDHNDAPDDDLDSGF